MAPEEIRRSYGGVNFIDNEISSSCPVPSI